MARRCARDEGGKLARHERRATVVAQAVADQPLGFAEIVDLGRVDEGAAGVEERLVGLDHRRVVRAMAPAVRADPDGRNLRARLAEGGARLSA